MGEAEWQTRKERIDTRLRALSSPWQIVPWREGLDTSQFSNHAVTEFPTENGPADYALFVNGVLLGIIEAKKVLVNPQNVLEQAKRYSRGAFSGPNSWNNFHVPFLYATNGETIWHLDARARPASPVRDGRIHLFGKTFSFVPPAFARLKCGKPGLDLYCNFYPRLKHWAMVVRSLPGLGNDVRLAQENSCSSVSSVVQCKKEEINHDCEC